MWDCSNCGAMNIAESVDFCPQCFLERDKAEAKPVTDSQPDGWPARGDKE